MHGALGQVLLKQGRFAEARDATRRALDLLPKRDSLRPLAIQQLQTCERLLALDKKLPAILKGEAKPANAQEGAQLADLCREYKKRYVAAVRLYTDAFAANPKMAEPPLPHRYNAACSAVLAGTGQGRDAAKLDDKERARLRQQALTWLRADLTAWCELLDKEPENARTSVEKMMQHWQQDADFARVRGDALAKLPEAERNEWRKLWEDVAELLKKAQEKK